MLQEIKATMTSREIADYTGRQHAHVMRDIREMEAAWAKINGSNFGLVEYADAKGEKRPMYELNKTECLYIATKFNDEARARLILRWEELESQRINLDAITRKDLAKMLYESEEEKERLQVIAELQAKQLKEASPKIDYYDSVLQAPGLIPTTVIAKDLGMSAVSLNKILSRAGVIYRAGNTWVLYYKYQDKGYTGTKTFVYSDSNGQDRSAIQTYWTEKGRAFVMDLVKRRGKIKESATSELFRK
jgi:Rha family phage regulatory protein